MACLDKLLLADVLLKQFYGLTKNKRNIFINSPSGNNVFATVPN